MRSNVKVILVYYAF